MEIIISYFNYFKNLNFENECAFLTHKCYRIVTSGAHDAQALHNTVPFKSFSIRSQSRDWDILHITRKKEKVNTQKVKPSKRHKNTLFNRKCK